MPRPRRPQWDPRARRYRTRIDGKYVRFPKGIGERDRPLIDGIPKAAWEYLALLERRREGEATAATDPTVYWLCELFLQSCDEESRAGRLSTGQYNAHVSQLKLFTDHPGISDLRARSLEVEIMDDFFDSLRSVVSPRTGKPYSAHYVANVGKSIRAMLNWSSRPVKGRNPSRLLADNPLRGYRFPRPPGAVRGYVDPKTVRHFYRWAWGRARGQPGLYRRFDRIFVLMLQFQRLTGCRPGEACGLEWSEIDWAARVIVFPPEKFKTGRKRGHETGRRRKIHLTPPVERILRALERLPGRHPRYVFTHRRGKHAVDRGQGDATAGEPWPDGSAASAKLRALRLAAIADGLPVAGEGPQKLVAYINRHGYVSDAVSSGLSHEQAANLVGNTAEVIRQVYAHAIDEADAERARALVRRGKPDGK